MRKLLGLLVVCAAAGVCADAVESTLRALQRGGHVVVMRHASSPKEPPAEGKAVAGNADGERQLDVAGRRGAAEMGIALRARGIAVSEVLTSPTFRARETALYAQLPMPKVQDELGDGGMSMQDTSAGQARWLREYVRKTPRGGNAILITHQPNMAAAFPQVSPQAADGESLVFRAGGKEGYTLVGRIGIGEWGPAEAAPEAVTFTTEDGAEIHGEVYGGGERGVVLAHGGRFNKETWIPQARTLAAAGFRVLAFDFRGYGESTGPKAEEPALYQDVLGAVRYLKSQGARTVAVVGGSMGGGATGEALEHQKAGEIDRVVFLGAHPDGDATKMAGRKLYILCRDDVQGENTPRLPGIQKQFEAVPQPKEMIVLECAEHAQFIFQSRQAGRLTRELLRFLLAP